MATRNTVVFIAPKSDGLNYGSWFYTEMVESDLNLTLIETDGTVEANDIAINNYNPILITGTGHGQCCVFTVESRAKYIEVGDSDCSTYFEGRFFEHHCDENLRLDKFKDRIVHLLSCITAGKLGPALIEHGAKAYIGYDNLFVYGVKSGGEVPSPGSLPDITSDFFSFIDSDVELDRNLIKGNNVGNAVLDSKNKYLEYIKKYTEGEWKERPVAPYALRFLIHDLNCQVSLGDESATITEKPLEFSMMSPIFLLGIGILIHQLLVKPITTN